MSEIIICGEMSNEKEKIFQLFGNVNGEMQLADIPIAQGVNVEALKKGDSDPLEVVVEIPASKSTRGWNYKANSLKDIVDAVNTNTLNGFLGHQKPEDIGSQFLPPVTHWIGARMEGENAYFRGVVDAAATDLKRWIRSGRIKQVSIFGQPKLQRSGKETNVVGYKPMSIDWTPLDRMGMKTRIVAMSGEMWDLEGQGPTGEMDDEKGGKAMTPEELLKELKKMITNKQLTIKMVADKLDMTVEKVAGEMDSNWLSEQTAHAKMLGKVKAALGVSGEMDIVEVATDAAKAMEEQATVGFEKIIGEMMDKKIESDAVKKDIKDNTTIIGKLWGYQSANLTADMDETKLAGEMDTFLADEAVKGIISNYHTDSPALRGTPPGSKGTTTLKTKRVSL